MFEKEIDWMHSRRNGTTTTRNLLVLLLLFFAVMFMLTVSPRSAHAQIIGEIEVTIPFQFHVGNAKLPAGKYIIHPLDNTDLTTMEISSADGSASALFEVRDAETNSAPPKTELIFNKYGNRYFLAKLFDEANPNGSTVPESRYEKTVSHQTAEAQAHVAAHHRGQQKG
jgi:hypothetical protein